MAKLSYEELLHIAATKKLVVADILKYENLKTDMVFTCKECKNRIVSNFESIRHPNWKCPHCDGQKVSYVGKPPKKEGYRIIACDQATQNFGISIYDEGKLVYFDVMEFSGELDKRYANIMKFMENVVSNWEPDLVVLEDIQLQQNSYGGYNAFKVLAGLLGVIKAVLAKHNVNHIEVLNKVWQAKFMISGKDRATQKKNVVKKVKELFDVNVSDDVADAILIGKWAVSERKGKNNVKLF